jgi:glycosyltransferase involved in cell wall biosynthesis
VISVSRSVLETHRSAGYFRKVPDSVIYNISDMQHDSVQWTTRPPEKPLVFGYIGRLGEEKGIRILLEAARLVPRGGWSLKVAGAGRNGYVADLKKSYPEVEWLGFCNPREFYTPVDVVVVPSLWAEPLPYVVVEALHNDKALICAHSGGIPELLSLARSARMYRPKHVSELAMIMKEAIADKENWRRGHLVNQGVLDSFSEDSIVSQYLLAYGRESGTSVTVQTRDSGMYS